MYVSEDIGIKSRRECIYVCIIYIDRVRDVPTLGQWWLVLTTSRQKLEH